MKMLLHSYIDKKIMCRRTRQPLWEIVWQFSKTLKVYLNSPATHWVLEVSMKTPLAGFRAAIFIATSKMETTQPLSGGRLCCSHSVKNEKEQSAGTW